MRNDAVKGKAISAPPRAYEKQVYKAADPEARDDEAAYCFWHRTISALGYIEHNPSYVIGDKIIVQRTHSVCQTGSAITTWQDNEAKNFDAVMRNGVVDRETGNSYLLMSGYKSALELRDEVRCSPLKDQPVNWCGRAFDTKQKTYCLERANNMFYKVLEQEDIF